MDEETKKDQGPTGQTKQGSGSPNHSQTDIVDELDALIRIGDFKTARARAKQLKHQERLDPAGAEKVAHVLKVTGNDPYVIGGFLFTLGVLAFLFFKYVF